MMTMVYIWVSLKLTWLLVVRFCFESDFLYAFHLTCWSVKISWHVRVTAACVHLWRLTKGVNFPNAIQQAALADRTTTIIIKQVIGKGVCEEKRQEVFLSSILSKLIVVQGNRKFTTELENVIHTRKCFYEIPYNVPGCRWHEGKWDWVRWNE
jgi:hypothetical protein